MLNLRTSFAIVILLQGAAAHLPPHLSFVSTAHAAERAEVAQGRGSVIKVDTAGGVVNMNHEAIPALKWPAMVMDFRVADKKLLAGIKPGQVVSFGLIKDPALGYIIARIEIAK